MNGFNPLGGLKNWHIYVAVSLMLLGVILGIWKFIELGSWCYHNMKIK